MIPSRLRPSIRAGNNTINHDDAQAAVLIDRMKEAGTEQAFLQAAHASVKGYAHRHSFKIRFETTWLDKPSRSPGGI
jgi:hypothetical protein